MGHRPKRASAKEGIGQRGHYQLLITYYQFSIVPHLSEKGYRDILFMLKLINKN